MEFNIRHSDYDQKMIIQGKPETIVIVFLAIWCSGALTPLFAFPFVIYEMLYEMGAKTLTCYHDTPKEITCKQVSEHFLGYGKPTEEVWKNVTKAEFYQTKDRRGTNNIKERYWITLKTPKKEIYIFNQDSYNANLNIDPEELKLWVSQFNQFAKSSEEKVSLTYAVNDQLLMIFPMFFILLFPGIAVLICYLLLQWHTLVFNRTDHTLTFEQRTIFGLKTDQFLFSNIREIKLLKVRGSKGGISYRCNLYINGKDHPISLTSISLVIVQEMAQTLREFLQIPVYDLTNQWSS